MTVELGGVGADTPGVMLILSVLWLIKAPASFVVVAGEWPGGLILLLSLGLPIQEAFFLVWYHKYLNLLNTVLHHGAQQ
jgi:hypothetical protein